jgi:hypothetical protein
MGGRTDPLYKIDNSLWKMSHAGIRCAETVRLVHSNFDKWDGCKQPLR